MSKQDRQGVRKASDIEQKYNLALLEDTEKSIGKQKEELSKFNQQLSELKIKLQMLENAFLSVGSIYTTLNTDNPSDLFGGEWELIAEGQLLVGLESESELPELFQGNDKCFVWKRTA